MRRATLHGELCSGESSPGYVTRSIPVGHEHPGFVEEDDTRPQAGGVLFPEASLARSGHGCCKAAELTGRENRERLSDGLLETDSGAPLQMSSYQPCAV